MRTIEPSVLEGTLPSSRPASIAIFVAPADGVRVLREVFRALQGDFPGAIVIQLQSGTGQERDVADNLNVASNVLVLPGSAGTPLRNGRAYVVADDALLAIDADGRLVQASEGVHEPLLASLASQSVGKMVVALAALTPEQNAGFQRVRQAGGHTLSLDETDRLWADSRGARIVPQSFDEILDAVAIGTRLLALASLAPLSV